MKKAVLDKLDRVVIPKDFCKELKRNIRSRQHKNNAR